MPESQSPIRLFDYLQPAIQALADKGEILCISAIRKGLRPVEAIRLADIYLQSTEVRIAYSQFEEAKRLAQAKPTKAETKAKPEADENTPSDDEGVKMKARMLKAQKRDLPLSLFSRYTPENTGLTEGELTLLAKTEYNIGRKLRELSDRFTGQNPQGGNYKGKEFSFEMQEAGQDGVTCLLCLQAKTYPPDFPPYLAEQLALGEKPVIVACRYMYHKAFEYALRSAELQDDITDKEMEALLSVSPFEPTTDDAIKLWLANVAEKQGKGLALRLARAYLLELRKGNSRLTTGERKRGEKRIEYLKRRKETLAVAMPAELPVLATA